MGLFSAYDLVYANEFTIKKNLSVNTLKTALELKEIKCFKYKRPLHNLKNHTDK